METAARRLPSPAFAVVLLLLLISVICSRSEAAVRESFFLVATSVPNSPAGGGILRLDPRTFKSYMTLGKDSPLYSPMAVDYDPVEDEIYWSEVGVYRRIRKTPMNGGYMKTVINGSSDSLMEGLAVDSVARLLFYTDAKKIVIGRVNLTSPHTHQVIISKGIEKPRAIALDTPRQRVYFTDLGTVGKIRRANYDGTNLEVLISSGLLETNALALNLRSYHMYWIDSDTDRVQRSDMNGKYRRTLIKVASRYHFFGMALYNDSLYMTDWGKEGSDTTSSQLVRVPSSPWTAGTDSWVVAELGFGRMNDIHAYDNTTDEASLGADYERIKVQAWWIWVAVIAIGIIVIAAVIFAFVRRLCRS